MEDGTSQIKLLILVAITCIFNSCATVLNHETTKINVITNGHDKIESETPFIESKGGKLIFPRQKDSLHITIKNDSIRKDILIGSRNSLIFWGNLYPGMWPGFLIDKNNPKRYSYPKRVYVDMENEDSDFYRYDPWNRKGQVYFNFAVPYVNFFLFKPDGEEVKNGFGFLGLTIGGDFYHGSNQFINISGTGNLDNLIPFPVHVDYSGEVEFTNSLYLSASNNHRIRNFTLGYGLSYAKNIWGVLYYDRFDPLPPTRDPIVLKSSTVGLVFPVSYQVGERFYVGAVYRPGFARNSNVKPIAYEHLISIDLGWKLRTW